MDSYVFYVDDNLTLRNRLLAWLQKELPDCWMRGYQTVWQLARDNAFVSLQDTPSVIIADVYIPGYWERSEVVRSLKSNRRIIPSEDGGIQTVTAAASDCIEYFWRPLLQEHPARIIFYTYVREYVRSRVSPEESARMLSTLTGYLSSLSQGGESDIVDKKSVSTKMDSDFEDEMGRLTDRVKQLLLAQSQGERP